MTTTQRNSRIIPLPRLTEPRELLKTAYHTAADTERQHAEKFVQKIYTQQFSATLKSFYPHLFSISNPSQDFIAVAGIRIAEDEQLFSEMYLNDSIEKIVVKSNRSGIIEIGNLAPARVGHARWLIASLTAWVYSAGFETVIFTVAPMLRNTFHRMGLELHFIADADINKVPHEMRSSWGSYYDTHPAVYYGDIHKAYKIMSSRMDRSMPRLKKLWDSAHRSGAQFAQQKQAQKLQVHK